MQPNDGFVSIAHAMVSYFMYAYKYLYVRMISTCPCYESAQLCKSQFQRSAVQEMFEIVHMSMIMQWLWSLASFFTVT